MKYSIIPVLLLALTLLGGCAAPASRSKAAGQTTAAKTTSQKAAVVTVTDSTGRTVKVKQDPANVVVLSSSWGELWQLAGGRVAGITSDALTEGRISLGKDVTNIGTVKQPNLELILAKQPDLVILSADIPAHTKVAASLKEAGIPSYTTKVEKLEDYLKVLKDFTDLTGDQAKYRSNGTDIKDQVEQLLAKVPAKPHPTALFLRAYSGGVNAIADNHVVCDILDHIGVQNIARTKGFPLQNLSLEAIMEQDPDYIFLVTMGAPDKAKAEVTKSLASNPAWQSLQAVQKQHVIYLDKDLYQYKPNARWAEAYEKILEIVYPDVYKQ